MTARNDIERVPQTVMTGHNRYGVMSNNRNPKMDPDEPVLYQIRIVGHLDRRWTDWLGGLEITLEEGGDTLLTGPVEDQAALHGLLRRVRDLGMPLISVSRVEPGEADASDQTHKHRSKKGERNE